jgi:hypothetical protein
MKAIALGVAFACVSSIAIAQSDYLHEEEQMCMTWLSLASLHAEPESEREPFGKAFQRLEKAVSARTDLNPVQAKKEADAAIKVWNDWTMDHAMATHLEDKIRLVSDAMTRAKACLSMAPGEDG